MKLRRKLMNRIARRLLRISHAMDGNRVRTMPPAVPKYGDFRRHSTPMEVSVKEAVEVYEKRFQVKEEARERVKRRLEAFKKQKREEDEVKKAVRLEAWKKEQVEIGEEKKAAVDAKNDAEEAAAAVQGVKTEEQATAPTDADSSSPLAPAPEQVKAEDANQGTSTPSTETPTADADAVVNASDEKEKEPVETQKSDSPSKDMEVDEPTATCTTTTTKTEEETEEMEVDTTEKKETEDMEVDTTEKKATEDMDAETTTTQEVSPKDEEEAASAPAVVDEIPSSDKEVEVQNEPDDDFVNPLLFDKEHQADLQILAEYDEDYNKLAPTTSIYSSTSITDNKNDEDDTTSSTTTHHPDLSKASIALTQDDIQALDKVEADFEFQPNIRSGIGAVLRTMTPSEKAMEWKRWQTEFLGRIPDQATVADLDREHVVFSLKERQEALQKEAEKAEGGAKSCDSSSESEKKTSDDAADTDKKEDKPVAEEKATIVLKKRTLSLEPIPSFYEQDYHRTLMIQSDLLTTAVHDHQRNSIAEVTKEYQTALRRSTDLNNLKTRLEKERNAALYDHRYKANELNKNRAFDIAMAKAKWQKEKNQFEAQKLAKRQMEMQRYGGSMHPDVSKAMRMTDQEVVRRSLMGAVDRVLIRNSPVESSTGSYLLSNAMQRGFRDNNRTQVVSSLAHCVDVVVRRVESGWISNSAVDMAKTGDQFPRFRPPDVPDTKKIIVNARGETLERVDSRIQVELKEISRQLATSEKMRSKAWQKLMNVKQQFNTQSAPPSRSMNASVPGNIGSSRKGYNQPAPMAYMQKQQQPFSQKTDIPSRSPQIYNPASMNVPTHSAISTGSSQSKYSADKVKARIFSDGSVMPVSAPKRGKDGLFMRPAGRQRKGMDWDAINGKWVPSGTLR
jgi:hypothetical protein